MLKKPTLIAAVIFVALILIFVFTRSSTTIDTVVPPYTLAPVEGLTKIEIDRPTREQGQRETIVIAQKDGAWWLHEPVEAPLDKKVSDDLLAEFSKAIATDDLPGSPDRADDYDLGAASVKVQLFGGGDGAERQFELGRQFNVERTGAQRTWLRSSDGNIYRAHTNLGSIVRKELDDLRSKEIVSIDRESLKEIRVLHHEGLELKLYRDGDGWRAETPEPGFRLESSVVNGLVNHLSNLRANGFAEERPRAELNLDPPQVLLVAETANETVRLQLGQPDPEGDVFVRIRSKPFVYQIPRFTGQNLMPDLNMLRARVLREIEEESITRVEFPTEDRLAVEKIDGSWRVERPRRLAADQDKVTSRLGSLTRIRASRYETIDLAESGLSGRVDSVVIRTTSGTYALQLGNEIEGKDERYAKWADIDHVFVLPKHVYQRFLPSVGDLTDDES